ncbi:MAG: hypothetical protein ACYC2I_04125 [Elusimicrobiales bacterium]
MLTLVFGFGKFYLIVLSPETVKTFFPPSAGPYFEDPGVLYRAFSLQVLGLAALCAALYFFSPPAGRHSEPPGEPAGRYAAAKLISLAAFSAIPICAYLVGTFGIGVLGVPSRPLPFHMSGAVFYLQIVGIPALLLCQILASNDAGARKLSAAGWLAMFLWAGTDAALRGSKGSLFLAPLLLIFLMLSGGFVPRWTHAAAAAVPVLAGVAVAPLITAYRGFRIAGDAGWQALLSAVSAYSISPSGLLKSSAVIFFRIPGVETAMVLAGAGAPVLWLAGVKTALSGGGLGEYITRTVFLLPPEYQHSFAPSFLGGSYLVGGFVGVAAAFFLAGAAAIGGWGLLGRMQLRSLPVARSLFLALLFWGVTEGVTPILLKQAASAVFFAALAEALLRLPEWIFGTRRRA